MPTAKQIASALAKTSSPEDLRLASRALTMLLEAANSVPAGTPNEVVAAALAFERLKKTSTPDDLLACKRVLDSILSTVDDLEDRAINDPFEVPERLDVTQGSEKEAAL